MTDDKKNIKKNIVYTKLENFERVFDLNSNHPTANFCKYILPEIINEYDKRNFLAGGAIRDWILDRTPKDYDIFFISSNIDVFNEYRSLGEYSNYTKNFSDNVGAKISLSYYEREKKAKNVKNLELIFNKKIYEGSTVYKIQHIGVFDSLLSSKSSINKQDLIISEQHIKRLFDRFDFTINKFAFFDGYIFYDKLAIMDLMKKKLRLCHLNVLNGEHLFNRILSFYEKGFTFCSEHEKEQVFNTIFDCVNYEARNFPYDTFII